MRKWTPSKIRQLRKRLGVSQTEFGQELIGVSFATVSRWESTTHTHSDPSPLAQRKLNELSQEVSRAERN
jgi:DNA-binding transcriptional regulator YiaG